MFLDEILYEMGVYYRQYHHPFCFDTSDETT